MPFTEYEVSIFEDLGKCVHESKLSICNDYRWLVDSVETKALLKPGKNLMVVFFLLATNKG